MQFYRIPSVFSILCPLCSRSIYADLTLGETLVLSNVSCYYQPFYSIQLSAAAEPRHIMGLSRMPSALLISYSCVSQEWPVSEPHWSIKCFVRRRQLEAFRQISFSVPRFCLCKIAGLLLVAQVSVSPLLVVFLMPYITLPANLKSKSKVIDCGAIPLSSGLRRNVEACDESAVDLGLTSSSVVITLLLSGVAFTTI